MELRQGGRMRRQRELRNGPPAWGPIEQQRREVIHAVAVERACSSCGIHLCMSSSFAHVEQSLAMFRPTPEAGEHAARSRHDGNDHDVLATTTDGLNSQHSREHSALMDATSYSTVGTSAL